jgi:hypothetical protein
VATWEDVARIVSELPETAEPSPRNWRVRKKLIAWQRPLRKADYAALGADAPDGDILGARVADEGVKLALIADDAGVYFTTPHFDGYPAVLAVSPRSACRTSKNCSPTPGWRRPRRRSPRLSCRTAINYAGVRGSSVAWLQQIRRFTAAREPLSPQHPSSLLMLSHSTRPARRRTR